MILCYNRDNIVNSDAIKTVFFYVHQHEALKLLVTQLCQQSRLDQFQFAELSFATHLCEQILICKKQVDQCRRIQSIVI